MIPFSTLKCPKCHAEAKRGARFCGACGESLPGSQIKCNSCGAVVAADKKFCGNCGKPLVESEAPLMKGNRWSRRVDDFATKVEVDDVDGFFKRGLIVESGTKAIFFVNGAYSGILDAGRYDMGGTLQNIKNLFSYKTTTAVLIDAGDAEIQFTVSEIATRDPIKLAADCHLVVQLEGPTQFFENLMKGRPNYPLSELREFLHEEVRNCVAEFIASRSVQELSGNLAFKQQLEQAIAQHLGKTFERKGLAFIQVRIFNFRHPRLDAITNRKEEYWLHAEDLKVQLAGQDSTMGLERRLLDQQTAGALTELEVFEDRAKVYDRMRKAVASGEMDRISNQNELEKFLGGIDRDKILRREEMHELTQGFEEKREDHDLARRHLIQRITIEEEIELARAKLLGQISLNRTVTEAERDEQMAGLEHELKSQRKKIDERQALEWSEVKHQLGVREAVSDAEMETARKKTDAEFSSVRKAIELRIELGAKTADAELAQGVKKTRAEIDLNEQHSLSEMRLKELEDDLDLRTAASSLDLLSKQKKIKADEAAAVLERELRARGGFSEVSMREDAQRHRQELEKIQVLSTLSNEALIAAAPSDRAAMLAELKRTETLKGFSEDQILAMSAEKNPEVARAFQEKFKNASSGEIQKAYERMLAMKDQGTADLKEMSRDYARMMQEMFNRGMDTQRDTATTRAAQPGAVVIAPGMGGPGVVHTGGDAPQPAARKVVCPACGLETEQGPKFCDNCGNKFA